MTENTSKEDYSSKEDNHIKNKLALLTEGAGVYLMKDKNNEIIYIGKAKNLKKRVSSYFNKTIKDSKTQSMLKHIVDFEYILTENEVESLILEAELVSKHQPHYNILLKDNKSFPFIVITNEMFPKIIKSRNVVKAEKNKNNKYKKYYGPFVDGFRASQIIKFIQDNYKIRNCKLVFPLKRNKKPCLYYHIKKCFAPCAGYISEEEYEKGVTDATKLLDGNVNELVAEYRSEMEKLAGELNFEKAKILRDRIYILKNITVEQSIYMPDSEDKDFIGLYGEDNRFSVVVLSMRNGKLIDRRSFFLKGLGSDDTVLRAFIMQYYSMPSTMPKEIIVSIKPDDINELKIWINSIVEKSIDSNKKNKVSLKVVNIKNGGMLAIAYENAKQIFKEKNVMKEIPESLEAIRVLFKMEKAPTVIESFDIAHIQGKYTMAGMVRFVNGKSDNKNYRLFNIKTVGGIDDFASMKEAVYRRYKRLRDEKQTFPDLILIDGGKGQLNAAIAALKELDIKKQRIVSLAKRFEEIYLPNMDNPIALPDNNVARLLLQKVRDETHRFVNTNHGKKRNREMLRSDLESLKSIGSKAIERLYLAFEGIDDIKKASLDSLVNVPGISLKQAGIIYNYFHTPKKIIKIEKTDD